MRQMIINNESKRTMNFSANFNCSAYNICDNVFIFMGSGRHDD